MNSDDFFPITTYPLKNYVKQINVRFALQCDCFLKKTNHLLRFVKMSISIQAATIFHYGYMKHTLVVSSTIDLIKGTLKPILIHID